MRRRVSVGVSPSQSVSASVSASGSDSAPADDLKHTALEDGSNLSIDGGNGRKRRMHWVMLMFMTYIAVYGGGAYVMEDQIAAAFPLLTFISILIMPWISGLPVALMTAELSSAMPVNGGYIVWMEEAFGPFWGFQMTVARVIDLALYPVLFTQYAQEWFHFDPIVTPLLNAVVVVISTTLNIFGMQVMGWLSIVLCVISLSPFFIFTVLGMPQVDPRTWITLPPDLSRIDWGLYIAVASWNVSGFDSLSQVAGEMKDSSKYYYGMIGSMILIMVSSFFPIAVMVSIDRDYASYYAGYWPELGAQVGGVWLQGLFTIGACVSMFATFNGYLFYGSIQISVWAEPSFVVVPLLSRIFGLSNVTADGYSSPDIPVLTKLSRWNTPYVAILSHALLVYGLSFLNFEDLVSTALYCIALILEYLALIDLRMSKPNMPRPYKIGCGTKWLILFCIPPGLFSAMNVVFAMASGYLTFAMIIAFVAMGPLLWFLRNGVRDCMSRSTRNVIETYQRDPESFNLLHNAPVIPESPPVPRVRRAGTDDEFVTVALTGDDSNLMGGVTDNELDSNQEPLSE